MNPFAYTAAPLEKQALQDAIRHRLKYEFAKNWEEHNRRDVFQSVALTVRDKLVEGMLATEARYQKEDVKRVYYLSIEFLIGRSLSNNLFDVPPAVVPSFKLGWGSSQARDPGGA